MDNLKGLVVAVVVVTLCHATFAENLRPIIGVLAQKNSGWHGYGDTFIRDTYFNFVQQAGARAVPIRVNESASYYQELFKSINGVLFPGGGVSAIDSGYAEAAKMLFKLAIEANDAGDYFPIWGTCLGFEQLAVLVGGDDVLSAVQGWNLTLPLDFVKDYKSTRMYSGLTTDIYKYVTTNGAAQNMHHYGLLTKEFKSNSRLNDFFNLLTTNTDKNGLEYVSSMEGKKYPFYGVQYHPEKNLYDWDENLNVNHERHAIAFSQSLADFFVQEARQSTHRFPSVEEESEALIQNYPAAYLGQPTFYRIYFFNYSKSAAEIEEASSVYMIMTCYQDNLNLMLAFLGVMCLVLILTHALRRVALRRRLQKHRVLQNVDAGFEAVKMGQENKAFIIPDIKG